MFSALLFGVLFVAAGVTGYNTDTAAALRDGTRWAGRVIVWEIALGSALLAIGVYLFRRLAIGRWVVVQGGEPRMKDVGRGRSSGSRALPGGP